MDKQAPTRKEPRQLIVLAAVEVPADIEVALRSGASGPKASSSEVLVSAISLVLACGRFLPPLPLSPSSDDRGPVRACPCEIPEEQRSHVAERLSPRHREVVGLLAQGQSNKMIARKLGLVEGTVKSHLVQIFHVLGVRNRTSAVMAAQELFASEKRQSGR